MNEKNPDAKTLVLNRVLEDLRRIRSNTTEPLVYFALVIAFLPDALSITFTMVLLITRRADYAAISLRRAVKRTRELAKWYGRYASASELYHRATRRWREPAAAPVDDDLEPPRWREPVAAPVTGSDREPPDRDSLLATIRPER